jgi:predicted NBD/HSP70 family sugar kinase
MDSQWSIMNTLRRPVLRTIPAVPGSLRRLNRLTILQLLRAKGPISKAGLAKISKISPPTVSKVIDDLYLNGLAEVVGTTTPSAAGGKPATLYHFHSNAVRVGAMLLAVDGVLAAMCDGEGRILLKASRSFGVDRSPQHVAAAMVTFFSDLLGQLSLTPEQLLGIGVGVPGLTDSTTGVVSFAPHLPGWQDVPLGQWLSTAFKVPVLLDNETHVQALAEQYYGHGAGCESFICIETGIGLSAALFFNGQLYRGASNTAGEIGHMTIQEDGPLCDCGNYGCWEALASTTWLANRVTEALLGDRSSSIAMEEDAKAQAAAIYTAALAGDALALELVTAHARHFGVGVANLINALNPEKIILQGESVAGGPPFLQVVREVVQERSLKLPRETVEIVLSDLGDDASLIGAMSLVMEALFSEGTYPAYSTSPMPLS